MDYLKCPKCGQWSMAPKTLLQMVINGQVNNGNDFAFAITKYGHTCSPTSQQSDIVDFDHFINAEDYSSVAGAEDIMRRIMRGI